MHRCSMKQKQLHHEDVLAYHSLVQGRIALIVRSIDGGPVLERERAQSKGMGQNVNVEPRWCMDIYDKILLNFTASLKF